MKTQKHELLSLFLMVALLGGVVAFPCAAVLVYPGDGEGYVDPPGWPDEYVPPFENVGVRGSASAVYLRAGWVLTANHVGAGDVVFGGVTHSWVQGSEVRIKNLDGTHTDLLLFQVTPEPNIFALPLGTLTPPYGTFMMMMGNGRNRGADTMWDPNGQFPPGLTEGFEWAPGHTLRWGTNLIETFPPGGKVFNTVAYGSKFDSSNLSFAESQLTTGDSGGAVFVWSEPLRRMEFVGLMLGVSTYSGQPASTSFVGQSSWYADVPTYREELRDVINMPEPRGGFGAGLALLVALARSAARRKQRAKI